MISAADRIPQGIRDVLACPKCRGALQDGVLGPKGARSDDLALVCVSCGLAFPVEEGIPVLLIERAIDSSAAV